MINKSKLSILIANFNHGIYIENLIKSIKQQTLQPEKIIIIDDGSTDNSHHILSKYINDDQFLIILNKNNLGVIERMNQGLKYLKTEYFMVYGADDLIIRKDAIEIGINALEKFPKGSLSSSLVFQLNDDYTLNKKIKSPLISDNTKYFSPDETLKVLSNYGNFINGHMTILRTKLFLDTVKKYPDISLFTDICCFLNLALQHGVVFIPKFLGGYRIQKDGFASKNFNNKTYVYRNFFLMLREIKKINYKKHNLKKLFDTLKVLCRLYFLKNSNQHNIRYLSILFKIYYLFKINLFFAFNNPTVFFHYCSYKLKYLIKNY